MSKVKAVNPVPQGYHRLTPYLSLREGQKAIAFYQKAFGAEERYRMPTPDGRLMHAELQIGDSILMLSDEFPEMDGTCQSPQALRGTTGSVMIYCEDTDALFSRAIQAGATEVMPPQDMFWGDRYARVRDPFGHEWQIATHIEDVTPQQMAERAKTAFSK